MERTVITTRKEIIELGHWTSDFQSFEQNLTRNTAPEEVYFIGSCSASQKHTPLNLISIIQEFCSCWRDADKYELSKMTLHNFNYLLKDKDMSKQMYPRGWKHFSHTGCVIIFNPNDIDFTLQLYGRPEQYKLGAGGMIFLKTSATFRYLTEEKSSKLKHMVVYSFFLKV